MGKIRWPETLRQNKLASCIKFSRGYSWPAPDPSGFERTGVVLPAVNAKFPSSLQFWLKGFLDSTDDGCVVTHCKDLAERLF